MPLRSATAYKDAYVVLSLLAVDEGGFTFSINSSSDSLSESKINDFLLSFLLSGGVLRPRNALADVVCGGNGDDLGCTGGDCVPLYEGDNGELVLSGRSCVLKNRSANALFFAGVIPVEKNWSESELEECGCLESSVDEYLGLISEMCLASGSLSLIKSFGKWSVSCLGIAAVIPCPPKTS